MCVSLRPRLTDRIVIITTVSTNPRGLRSKWTCVSMPRWRGAVVALVRADAIVTNHAFTSRQAFLPMAVPYPGTTPDRQRDRAALIRSGQYG